MPNFAATYSSEYLPAERMLTALRQLPGILEELLGKCMLSVHYGVGSNLHSALLYVPMAVATEVLPSFLEDSIAQTITVPGESDLLIASPAGELEVLFCHEADIHVDGKSRELMQRFIASRQLSDIKFYSKDELGAAYPDWKL